MPGGNHEEGLDVDHQYRVACGNPDALSDLEQHLARAADLLRGSIDQADFKAYIFPLMFFKRLDDVYEEEFQLALEESGGDLEYAGFAENHAFVIPEDARWESVRARTENVGQALVTAFHVIEAANPRLAVRHLQQRRIVDE